MHDHVNIYIHTQYIYNPQKRNPQITFIVVLKVL